MDEPSRTPPSAWGRARFGDCALDRPARELWRAGRLQRLDPGVFDLLVHLIEHRDDTVSREGIRRSVLPDRADGELARKIMKLRQAVGDDDPARPMIKTQYRVGYRFVADVTFGEPAREAASPAPAAAGVRRRLAVLPIRNETGERDLAWVELGLLSMLAKALDAVDDWSLVPVHDVVSVFGAGPERESAAALQQAVEAALGTRALVQGRLTGKRGAYLLEFEFVASDGAVRHGAIAGLDPVQLAADTAVCVRRWMSPSQREAAETAAFDDEFLNEAFAMALQRHREFRFLEAERILDLLDDADAERSDLLLEQAHVRVMLGRSDALSRIERVERAALARRDDRSLAHALALRGTLHEQQGQIAAAADSMQKAAELAGSLGLDDLAVQWTLDCAHHLANAFDPRAQAWLSRAFSRAERLGNRVLLSQAYWVAGKLAGLANDWNTACHYHGTAVATLRALGTAVQFAPSSILAWSRAQLGALQESVDTACDACDGATRSGRRPEHGLTLGAAAHLCLMDRRVGRLVALYRASLDADDDASVAMTVARAVHGEAALLCIAGRHDEALERLAEVTASTAGNPVLFGRCQASRLQVLLQARRFEALHEACEELLADPSPRIDPRLLPWVERAQALRQCFCGSGAPQGLQRLEAVFASTPACECQAIAGLEAAWLHLERGQADAAQRIAGLLPLWMQQTPAGLQVDARLRHALGDVDGAQRLQASFLQRYADTATGFDRRLLEAYETDAAGGRRAPIEPLTEPIDLHWRASPERLDEVRDGLLAGERARRAAGRDGRR